MRLGEVAPWLLVMGEPMAPDGAEDLDGTDTVVLRLGITAMAVTDIIALASGVTMVTMRTARGCTVVLHLVAIAILVGTMAMDRDATSKGLRAISLRGLPAQPTDLTEELIGPSVVGEEGGGARLHRGILCHRLLRMWWLMLCLL